MNRSVAFASGVAVALLAPSLAYCILGAMYPEGHGGSPVLSILVVCAGLVLVPTVLAFLGFLAGAYSSNYSENQAGAFRRGAINSLVALVFCVSVFPLAGTDLNELVFVVVAYLACGYIAAFSQPLA